MELERYVDAAGKGFGVAVLIWLVLLVLFALGGLFAVLTHIPPFWNLL